MADSGSGSGSSPVSHPAGRSHKDRVLQELSLAMKLRSRSIQDQDLQDDEELSKVPSDEVDRLHLMVRWQPDPGALGFSVAPADLQAHYDIVSRLCVALIFSRRLILSLRQAAGDLNFEGLLSKAVKCHSTALLKVFRRQLCEGPYRSVFANSEEVVMAMDGTLMMNFFASNF